MSATARPALAIAHTGAVKSRTHSGVTRRLTGTELETVIRRVGMVVDHHRRMGAKADHAAELAGADLGMSPRAVRTLLHEPHLATMTRADADAFIPALQAFMRRAAADCEARAANWRALAEALT